MIKDLIYKLSELPDDQMEFALKELKQFSDILFKYINLRLKDESCQLKQ